MQHTYLLINSHMGADLTELANTLLKSSDISVNVQSLTYRNWHDLAGLENILDTRCRILADLVILNQSMHFAKVPDECKILLFLGDPLQSVSNMVNEGRFGLSRAVDYYSVRLQRMAHLSRMNKERCFLLTHDQLYSGDGQALSKFLDVETIRFPKKEKPNYSTDAVGQHILSIHDKYLALIRRRLELV